MLDDPIQLTTGFPKPLSFRKLSSADASTFAEHVARDVDHLGAHLPWPSVTDNVDGARDWLAAYENRVDGRVLVAGAFAGDELVGGSLLLSYAQLHRNVELGVWVVSAAEGKGVASAACLALIALARHELHVERIEWTTTTENTRSRRLAEKLGFVFEGTRRWDYDLRGKRHDTWILSLVGEEIDQAIARG
jgi:ribosomal-protein-serine acetyltransferase